MRILDENNLIVDTDVINKRIHYSVLSLKDYKNPDFYFEELSYIEHFESPAIELSIGPYKTILPLVWSIMVSDSENVELLPLYEISGKHHVFAMNPISGYRPRYLPLRTHRIFKDVSWTCPPLTEKKLLVVPLDYEKLKDERQTSRGPICAIFSATKMEINKAVSDIW